jgi:hypothetical protein
MKKIDYSYMVARDLENKFDVRNTEILNGVIVYLDNHEQEEVISKLLDSEYQIENSFFSKGKLILKFN